MQNILSFHESLFYFCKKLIRMKKQNKKHEEEEPMIVNEPIVGYGAQGETNISKLPFISMNEVHQNGMSLEESRRRIFEKIYLDFHKA